MNTKSLLIIAIIWLFGCNLNAQNIGLDWAKSIGGTGSDYCKSITTDVMGNIYLTGYFNNTVDFDPGSGVFNLSSNGSSDIFIQKLDSSGNLIWVKSIGGSSYDEAYSITTDNIGNVYVTGFFRSIVDFNPGSGIANFGAYGQCDLFVLKLNSSGNFVWAKVIGKNGYDKGNSIITDASGNIYVTGNFEFTVDFNPGSGVNNLVSNGLYDIFVLKLSSSGSYLWAKSMGGSDFDYGNSIINDGLGNIYLTGSYTNTVDFDPGISSVNLTSNGNSDIFIQKLNSLGDLVWVKSFGASGSDKGYSLATKNSTDILITGSFSNTVDFDPSNSVLNLISKGSYDVFIQNLDSAGNLTWATSVGGSGDDQGISLATDDANNILVTGYFEGTADFNPNSGVQNLISKGLHDIFTLKLDSLGDYVWAISKGGKSDDYGRSIHLNTAGSIYTAGEFRYTVDFNPNSGVLDIISNGGYDMYIEKLKHCTPFSNSQTITACNNYTWLIDSNTYTVSGIYNAIYTNASGCDSIYTLNLTIHSNNSTVSQSGATFTSTQSGAAYQWLDCNNAYAMISGASNQSFTATVNGNYAVKIIKNGCVDTSACFSISNVGIIENTFGHDLNLFPNPTSRKVNLELGTNYKEIQVSVRNSEGKLTEQQEFENEQSISLDIEGRAGIYFVEVIAEGKSAIIKIVKQ